MRKRLWSTVSTGLVVLIVGLCIAAPAIAAPAAAGRDATSQASTIAGGDPQWTLIFYLAADNAQEAYAEATLSQLEAATARTPNHPQVIVLIDRLSVTGTDVFEIVDGDITSLTRESEQNTADGSTLEAFATEALGLAGENNVAFIMKSEGFSWRGIGRDNTHDAALADQLMPTGDLAEALINAQREAGKNVDLLVLEGAIMAFIEVVYELRDAAPWLLATQSKIQPDGLPWEMVITDLGETPGMSAETLGITIADDFQEYYMDKGNNGVPHLDTSINFAALTLFDLSHMDDVLDAHRHWAETTWQRLDDVYNILPHARDLSEVGGYGEITEFDYNFDIETFMVESLRLIAEAGLSFPDLDAAVADYLAQQDKLVAYERSPDDGFKLKAATGMSIWYPPTWNKYETRDENDELFGSTMYYEDADIALDWVTDANWTTYLFEYFDRADAKLAGHGPDGDEPPKPGVFRRLGPDDD